MTYIVTAPLVVAKLDGGQMVHLYHGTPLPENVDADQLQQLLESEMVGEGGNADEVEPAEEQVSKPDGRASREKWAEYARTQGATDEELRPVEDGGLTQADLRAKYGA